MCDRKDKTVDKGGIRCYNINIGRERIGSFMDLLIFSDSHGNADAVQRVIDRSVSRPDAIFFLGDGLRDLAWLDTRGAPIYAVRGNCDLYSAEGVPTELDMELGGLHIFASHGHLYSVKSGFSAMAAHAAGLGADIMLFGHTHEAMTETFPAGSSLGGVLLTKPLCIINPGSVGSGYDATFATLTLRSGQIIASIGEA